MENFPEELDKYCRGYNGRMKELLNGKGDSIFTIKSHIFEAVAIAAADEVCRLQIARNIVKRVILEKDDYNSLDLIEDVGRGKLMLTNMRRRFKALFSIGWKRTFYRIMPHDLILYALHRWRRKSIGLLSRSTLANTPPARRNYDSHSMSVSDIAD
jgi:hypothetical protein